LQAEERRVSFSAPNQRRGAEALFLAMRARGAAAGREPELKRLESGFAEDGNIAAPV
jgi:hypothetical protein